MIREIIHSILFIFVRLGIFVALLAWGISLSWSGIARVPILGHSFDVFFVSSGYSVHTYWDIGSVESRLDFGRREDIGHYLGYFQLTFVLDEDDELLFRMPGLEIATFGPNQLAFSIHHWLIVALFFVLYIWLRWMRPRSRLDGSHSNQDQLNSVVPVSAETTKTA